MKETVNLNAHRYKNDELNDNLEIGFGELKLLSRRFKILRVDEFAI